MLVSIIVPVYNVAEYLAECLDSVISQSYNQIEVILIDDGSTDGSEAICDEYAQRDKRIKVIHNSNHGVGYSRNAGLQMAVGECIAFVDPDDYLEGNFLEKMVGRLVEHRVDIVACNYSYVKHGAIIAHTVNIDNKIVCKEEICEHVFIDNAIGGFVWNKLFRANIIKGIFFEETMNICEDTFYFMNVLSHQPKVYYMESPLYYYRIRENSAVNKIENIFDEDNNLKYASVFNQIKEKQLLGKNELNIIYACLCIKATGVKCDLKLTNSKNKQRVKKLNKIIWSTMSIFLKSNKVATNKKIVVLLNHFFNIRRIKKLKSR